MLGVKEDERERDVLAECLGESTARLIVQRMRDMETEELIELKASFESIICSLPYSYH